MQAPPDIRSQIEAALDRLNDLVSRRDLAILSEFAEDALFVGSVAGEVVEGQRALAANFQGVFARSVGFAWEWRELRVWCEGDLAWLFADGEILMTGPGGQERAPYQVTGVLQRRQGRWVWRQFHGAEPVPAG